MRPSRFRRPVGRILGAAVIIAVTGLAGTANAGQSPDALIKEAEARYPVDAIPSPDREGEYRLRDDNQGEGARQARVLLTRAAAAGSARANRMLGEMVEAGVGGPRDFIAARDHYRTAGNDRQALWRLGLLTLAGWGGTADPVAARALFRRSSEAGQIDAAYEYGRMVELGIGGPRDPGAARGIYAGTLDFCHGDIANRLSVMMVRGIGGPVDRPRAAAMQVRAFECHNEHFETPAAIARPDLFDREAIVEIQKKLKEDDDYQGPLDGRLNRATIDALRARS